MHLLLARYFCESFGEMGDMQLACCVPSPRVCLSRLEGVVSEEDPAGEPLWSPPPLTGGGEAQAGGLRSQPW